MTQSVTRSYTALVQRADPDYRKDFRESVEYRFGKKPREFKGMYDKRGPYTPEDD